MPKNKLKTHKGTAKVLKARKNDFKIGKQGMGHNSGKKNAVANRNGRKGSTLSSSDYSRIKGIIGK